MRTYECMFLIDNDAVRAGWNGVKSDLSSLVEKHGGQVATARRWDERRLAYPIRHRNRATYLLAWCHLVPEHIAELRRELDISETVLRYLITSNEVIPAEEQELSAAESADDFQVPEPPADDADDAPVETEETTPAAAPAPAEGGDGAPAQAPPAEPASEKPAKEGAATSDDTPEPVTAGQAGDKEEA